MQIVYTIKEFRGNNNISAQILAHAGMKAEAAAIRDMPLKDIEEMSPFVKIKDDKIVIEIPEEKMLEVTAVIEKHIDIIAPVVLAVVNLFKVMKGMLSAFDRDMKNIKFD